MPIYEYRCTECERRQSRLLLSGRNHLTPKCRACGSGSVVRILSTVSVGHSEEQRLTRWAHSAPATEPNGGDASAMIRWARGVGSDVGADAMAHTEQVICQMGDRQASGASAGTELL